MKIIIPEQFRHKILPRGGLDHVSRDSDCLFAISLGSANSQLDDLVSTYKWIENTFSKCAILIGDSLFKLTLEIEQSLTPSVAAQKAHKSCSEFLKEFQSQTNGRGQKIIRSSELNGNSDYEVCKTSINSLYNQNANFAISVNNDASSFVERKIRQNKISSPHEKFVKKSVDYLLEEISVYLFLAKSGWTLEVYYGEELPTLARIIRHEIPGVPAPLLSRINISVRRRIAKGSVSRC